MNNIKKYLIWFIVGLLWVWTMTYAAGNGNIGSLFEFNWTTSKWEFLWGNIKNSTISKNKLDVSLASEIDWKQNINTLDSVIENLGYIKSYTDVTVNKVIIWNWTISENTDWELEFSNWWKKFTINSLWEVEANQYNLR
jgi:hypothetical protein